MSVETKFRILLGYLLVMRWAIGWYCRRNIQALQDQRSEFLFDRRIVRGRRTSWWLFSIPAILLILIPRSATYSVSSPETLRWISAGIAFASLLLVFWSLHVATKGDTYDEDGKDQLVRLLKSGPFRSVRHPIELADAIFMISAVLVSGSIALLIATLASISIFKFVVITARETVLADFTGVENDEHANRVPRGTKLKSAQYQVPTRFNLTAIIALMTILSIVFGALNYANSYFQVHPTVYLFLAGQIVAVCLGQMFFKSAPRAVSIIVGAILLPTFVLISIEMSGANLPTEAKILILCFCAVMGALSGYCIGTLAAGFFLVADLIENWLVGARRNGASAVHPAPSEDESGEGSAKHGR